MSIKLTKLTPAQVAAAQEAGAVTGKSTATWQDGAIARAALAGLLAEGDDLTTDERRLRSGTLDSLDAKIVAAMLAATDAEADASSAAMPAPEKPLTKAQKAKAQKATITPAAAKNLAAADAATQNGGTAAPAGRFVAHRTGGAWKVFDTETPGAKRSLGAIVGKYADRKAAEAAAAKMNKK